MISLTFGVRGNVTSCRIGVVRAFRQTRYISRSIIVFVLTWLFLVTASQSSTNLTRRTSGMGILTSGRFRYCSSCISPKFKDHAVECKYLAPAPETDRVESFPPCPLLPFRILLDSSFPLVRSIRRRRSGIRATRSLFRRARFGQFSSGLSGYGFLSQSFLLVSSGLVVLHQPGFGDPFVPSERSARLVGVWWSF